jgi:hypothetical protein
MVLGKTEHSTVSEQLASGVPAEKLGQPSTAAQTLQPIEPQLHQELRKSMSAALNIALLFARSDEFRGLIHELDNILLNIVSNRWKDVQPALEQAAAQPTEQAIAQAEQKMQQAAEGVGKVRGKKKL